MNKLIKWALIGAFSAAGLANAVVLFTDNVMAMRSVGSLTMLMLLAINGAMIYKYAVSKKVKAQ
jgi:hypothetical protein